MNDSVWEFLLWNLVLGIILVCVISGSVLLRMWFLGMVNVSGFCIGVF